MTHKTNSGMSSPITISGMESISDVESTISVGDKAIVPETPGNFEGGLFDLGDGDIRLMVNGVTLETHKYLIKRFSGLRDRIQNNTITIDSNGPGVEDFRNTFKILYASVIEGPFHFDHLTLTSALRIATTYDYPALRSFSIKHLEKASLSAVERIWLAREFGLPSWEEPAYVELCNREEAMTKEEASVLGLDTFVHVARIREKEQRRRGKDIDAMMESDDESQMGEETAGKARQAEGKKKKKAKKSTAAVLSSNSCDVEQGQVTSTETDNKGEVGIIPDPSFIDIQTVGTRWRPQEYNTWVLDVPGCQCTGQAGWECALPPCVATAIKHLQTQQLAHNTGISKLETTMEHVQATLTSLAAPQTPVEPDLREPNQTEGVQIEVRKWLVSVKSGIVVV